MHDLPLSSEEIVESAQRNAVNDPHVAYEKHRKAKETGGPCEVCGWRDGDGIKACFYHPDLGAVTHQNSARGAEQTMTPEQIRLHRLHHELLYVNAELCEKHIRLVKYQNRQRENAWVEQHPDIPFRTNSDGDPVSLDEFMRRYRTNAETKPLGTESPYRGWVEKPWWIPASDIPERLRGLVKRDRSGEEWTAYMAHYHEPHPGCGGIKVGVGPYHFKCSKCGTEVRLWEHGIDYDVG